MTITSPGWSFDRLPSLDPRRPVLRIGHGSARRIGSTAFKDVVNLRHVVTVTFLRVHALSTGLEFVSDFLFPKELN